MERKTSKILCVTGYQKITEDKLEFVRQRLREEVLQAIQDGFGVFLSGYAEGIDLEFAKIVADLRDTEYPRLFLEAVVPGADHLEPEDKLLQEMRARVKGFKPICREYNSDSRFLCNRDMISHSDRVIAVTGEGAAWDVVFAINYAITMEKDVRYINV